MEGSNQDQDYVESGEVGSLENMSAVGLQSHSRLMGQWALRASLACPVCCSSGDVQPGSGAVPLEGILSQLGQQPATKGEALSPGMVWDGKVS